MTKIFARFAKDDAGATAIEYGLIAALMSVGLIAAFPTAIDAIKTSFTNIAAAMAAI